MSVSSKGAKTYNHACVRNKRIAPPTDLGDRLEQPGADGVAESESMYGGLRVIHPDFGYVPLLGTANPVSQAGQEDLIKTYHWFG
jgi:hypothetical protein